MDGKTSKPAFDKARTNKKSVPRRNYTHKELIMKTDAYASVAKTKEQEKEMLDLKDEYYVDKEKTVVNRFVRNRNFEMGKRAGLHQGIKWLTKAKEIRRWTKPKPITTRIIACLKFIKRLWRDQNRRTFRRICNGFDGGD